MQTSKFVLPLAIALALTACGGGAGGGRGIGGAVIAADGPQAVPLRFAAEVTFGDSTSDVGTYAVSSVVAGGGGKFTINGDGTAFHPELNGKIWSEMIASQLGLPAPCAAQTGLQGDPNVGLLVPVVNHPGCFGYAQGNARITDPVGIDNAATGSSFGALTVPVSNQVANHLASVGGRFQGNELVLVMAGEDEVLTLWRLLSIGANAAAQAAGPAGAAQARQDYLLQNGPLAISTAGNAGSDLAAIVRDRIVAQGANYVVVNNVPDMSATPQGMAEDGTMRSLLQTIVDNFNHGLKAGLDPLPQVAQVDVHALSQDEAFNPAFYALSNTTVQACGPNVFGGNALICNIFNTFPGVDVSHFLFADSVHLTPYGHWLMARQVVVAMAGKGWM